MPIYLSLVENLLFTTMKKICIYLAALVLLCLSSCRAGYFRTDTGPYKLIVLKFKEGMYLPDNVYHRNAQLFGPKNYVTANVPYDYPHIYYIMNKDMPKYKYVGGLSVNIKGMKGLFPLENDYFLATTDWEIRLNLFDITWKEAEVFKDSTTFETRKVSIISDDIYEHYYTRDDYFHPGSLNYLEYRWSDSVPPADVVEKLNEMIRNGSLGDYFDEPLEGKYHLGSIWGM